MGSKPCEEASQKGASTIEQLFEHFGELHVLDDIIRLRAADVTQHPIFAYPTSENDPASYEYFSGRDLDGMIDQAVQVLLEQGFKPPQEDHEFIRLGYTIMILSTRLSAAACVSLLDRIGCDTILYGQSPSIRTTLNGILRSKSITCRPIIQRASSDQAQDSPSVLELNRSRNIKEKENQTALILHSSGSTGFPKPIFLTHKALMMHPIRGPGLTAFNSLPWFHLHGLSTAIQAMYMRKTAFMWNASLPLTASGLVAALEEGQPESVHGVPYMLQMISDDPRGIELLRKCKLVTYGGAPCPDELGDRLVREGVPFSGAFGSTEAGLVAESASRPRNDPYWNYFRFFDNIQRYIWMKPIGDSLNEVVYLAGLPALVSSNSDEPPGSYHSRDVFTPHPTIPGRWKYVSRLDDRITLVNGEKVLPVPIEGTVKQNPLVQEAVVVGIGKAVPGLLIFRSEESTHLSDEEYLDSIWLTVQEANERTEKFSQIARDMVTILPHDAPCPRTDKGSFIRMQVYSEHAEIIESMYTRLEQGETGTLELDIPGTKAHLIKLCQEELGLLVSSADADLFSEGVDSLKAIHLRRLILGHFKFADSGAISQNVVFETASIARLAEHVCAVQGGRQTTVENEVLLMPGLIEKYSRFHHDISLGSVSNEKSAILTGATGSIGAHTLVTLLDDSSISAVYCLTRRSNPKDAIMDALSQKGLQVSHAKAQKIIALNSALDKPDLGVDKDTLSQMQQLVSLIIHTAWPVNFNLPLSSFEPHIKGLHNLLQFSLSVHQPTPAALFFCSSISTALGSLSPKIYEKPIALHSALDMGYARSKLVGEHMVSNARKSGARAYSLRIGQVSGHSEKGLWNDSEAMPLMIRSALTLKALPELDVDCAWLPVDQLARVITDIAGTCSRVPPPSSPRSNSSSGSTYSEDDSDHDGDDDDDDGDDNTIYNLCNPRAFTWSSLLTALREHGFEFKTVPFQTWLQMLRDSEARGEELVNPAVKLTAHYEAMYSKASKSESQSQSQYQDMKQREKRFLTRKAESDGMSLRDGRLRIIEDGVLGCYARDWLRRWRVHS